jgi:lipoprotein NlpI
MGANMRRIVLICSAMLAMSVAGADAQSRLKRDDTQAAAQAAQPAATAPKKPNAAKRAGAPKQAPEKPAAPDTRPRLKRDDMPAAVATTPAAPLAGKKTRGAGTKGAPEQQADGAAGARASAKDVVACAQPQQPDAALEGCSRIIEDQKQKPKARAVAFFNRGNAALAKGDHDKAIADFDEAIKLDPKSASAYNNRGSARSDKGEADAAIEDFNAAIKRNARYASAYFNRANVFAARDETDRAIKDYDTAIKYNRRSVNAYIARGALMLARGASAKARADMRQAAALDAKNAYAVLWHDIAERRARHKGVLADGKGLKNVEMKGWPAPVLLMFVGEIKQDAVLEAADKSDPAHKQAYGCEANFYSGEYALIGGNRDEAVKLFQAAVKDCPRGFLEGIAAAAELKALGIKLGAN